MAKQGIEGPTADRGASGEINLKFERRSSHRYYAYFDPTDDEVAVLKGCGFTIGTVHPSDRQQVLSNIRVDNPRLTSYLKTQQPCLMWDLEIEYGPWNPAELGDPSKAGQPLQMPPRVRLEWKEVPEPVWEDVINQNPIVNAAGDPFDPPIEVDNLIGVLTVERNEPADFDIAGTLALSKKVNAAEWNGWDAKMVRVAPIALPALEYSQEAEIYYYPMVYVFEINFETWVKQVLNLGYRKLVNGKRITILDDSGQPLSNPGMLDQNGDYIKPPVTKDNIYIAEFDIYKPTDFSAFNMDSLFTPPGVLE